MADSLKVAFAQITSNDSPQQNLALILQMLEKSPEGCDLYCFPENSFYFRIDKSKAMVPLKPESGELVALQKVVETSKKSVLIGGTPFLNEGQVVNGTLFLSPGQEPQLVYSKAHLFDVDVSGEKSVRESDDFAAGNEPALLQINGFNIGLSICYDLRFSELYLYYALKQADVLFVPAAFLPTTGQAHWQTLLRARAIESQCYVIAPAQFGEHTNGLKSRYTFGHSLAVDPWGKTLVNLETKNDVWGEVLLSRSDLTKVRTQIPMSSHRRAFIRHALNSL